jgi:hypothetical protein
MSKARSNFVGRASTVKAEAEGLGGCVRPRGLRSTSWVHENRDARSRDCVLEQLQPLWDQVRADAG